MSRSKKIMRPNEKDEIEMADQLTPELANKLVTRTLINMANGNLNSNLGNGVIDGIVKLTRERRSDRRHRLETKDTELGLLESSSSK